ncbi:T9SS type A sorting domain-containing protein [Flavobacterium sp.]|uniref:T9SS type A sorting domain-containing protein n=1 Tax=Flavobacterium sp. TaxID=239 RepID=UPI0037C039FC
MKPFLFILFACFFLGNVYSQGSKIRFEYDAAGNQIQRSWCPTCASRNSNQEVKEVSELKDEDLQKFFPEDVISYYPNPVREELYLKWELINENKVTKMDVTNLTGQIIQSYSKLENENAKSISFQEYPAGIYFITLQYTNGEFKSIKIIKK